MELSVSLILIGLKHTGKTTLGKMLAGKAGCPFFDLDVIIETLWAEHNSPLPLRKIFLEIGLSAFSLLERDAAAVLRGKLSGTKAVAALGGGTPENEGAMRELEGAGKYILLKENRDILYGRIMKDGRPAFLSEESPYEDFTAICDRRDPVFDTYADYVVETDGREEEAVFAALLEELKRTGYGG